ncbi:hypothetical protein CEXT_34821 [Caerostris extrusa]|uniref:Uncharacterized protein n=1 Tax=Caerostris extrusa TaxID=172846 RepID=A0AAV4QNK5_CAEEX|nr:hypothetical protein CEXT_34821 [Caerostris extrusa]
MDVPEQHAGSLGDVLKQMSGKTKFRCNKDSIFQFTERETDFLWMGDLRRDGKGSDGHVTACPESRN